MVSAKEVSDSVTTQSKLSLSVSVSDENFTLDCCVGEKMVWC